MTCHVACLIYIFTFTFTGTFDVQKITIENHPEQICVHCIYANGSNAKGCRIKLEEIMTELKTYRNTSRPACFPLAEEGNYTLMVYDIEENETDETTEVSVPAIIERIAIAGPSMLFLSPLYFSTNVNQMQVKMEQVTAIPKHLLPFNNYRDIGYDCYIESHYTSSYR